MKESSAYIPETGFRITADGLRRSASILRAQARGLRMEMDDDEVVRRLLEELEAKAAALDLVADLLDDLENPAVPF
jgi:hypothetical protein